jgi:hypothetical protein
VAPFDQERSGCTSGCSAHLETAAQLAGWAFDQAQARGLSARFGEIEAGSVVANMPGVAGSRLREIFGWQVRSALFFASAQLSPAIGMGSLPVLSRGSVPVLA